LGWYNANPTELAGYPDAEKGKRYVKAMGGEESVLQIALEFFNEGDYRFTVEILNNIIAQNPGNTKASLLMADAFEQLGYQEENALYRNWYLSAANELRIGGNVPNNLSTTSPDVIASLPTGLLMEYLSMLTDQIKAENAGNYSINLKLTKEVPYNLEMHNGVLIAVKNYSDSDPDLEMSISKIDFIKFLYGEIELDKLSSSGKTKIKGKKEILSKLKSVIDLNIKNNMNLVLPLQEDNRIK
jgi:alkyl sulfatase BDS1-like metallo-beta-lactamase superfamily hydrolase